MFKIANYKPTFWFKNTHINTIYAGRYRKIKMPHYQREKFTLPDGDFINLDWVDNDLKRIVVIVHGLGGHSQRHHVMGLANVFTAAAYDVLAINCRGAGDEPNDTIKTYHSGASDDLSAVIQYVIAKNKYDTIQLVGYSLGGNVILKYLGEQHTNLSKLIRRAAVMSVPCELSDSSQKMKSWNNKVYIWNFFKTLKPTAIEKSKRFPGHFDLKKTLSATNFEEFDDAFTAPVNGFESALHYHKSCSSLYFLDKITIPTYLLQAEDDTFLSKSSFPVEIAKQHPFLHLEVSKYGGHVGFSQTSDSGYSWAEQRFLDFIAGEG